MRAAPVAETRRQCAPVPAMDAGRGRGGRGRDDRFGRGGSVVHASVIEGTGVGQGGTTEHGAATSDGVTEAAPMLADGSADVEVT